jgi:hypothetical protein
MTEVSEAEAHRRYMQGELDKVTPSEYTGKVKVKFWGEGESHHLNITAAQFEAIKKIIAPEDPSPVSYDPCIQGTVEIEGRTSEFLILLDRDDVGFSQWGADNTVLWERVSLLDPLSVAAKEWALENLNREEGGDA